MFNSLEFSIKFEKNFQNVLINVFGEWDKHHSGNIKMNFNLGRLLLKENLKDFKLKIFIFPLIFFFLLFSFKKGFKKDEPDYLIIHLITSIPILMFLLNDFKTKLILRISGSLQKLNFLRFLLKIASKN